MKLKTSIQCFAVCLLAIQLLGCGRGGDYPDIGAVTGTITMNGRPLSGAIVTFIPQGHEPGTGSRQSVGRTNDQGEYELTYSISAKGAKVGECQVRISNYIPPGPGGEDGDFQKGRPETVPAQYNTESKLVETVEAGSNVFDFDLKMEGAIDSHAEDDDITEEDF